MGNLTALNTFTVDTGGPTGTDYNLPRVFGLPNGNIAVVLNESQIDNVAPNVADRKFLLRIYDPNGVQQGGEINISSLAPSESDSASYTFAPLSNGNILFAYFKNDSSAAGSGDAFFRIIDAAGNPVTPETRINATPAGANQISRGVEVAQLSNGNLAFAWHNADNYDTSTRVFAVNGSTVTPITSDIDINGDSNNPSWIQTSVTAGANGTYTVAIANLNYGTTNYQTHYINLNSAGAVTSDNAAIVPIAYNSPPIYSVRTMTNGNNALFVQYDDSSSSSHREVFIVNPANGQSTDVVFPGSPNVNITTGTVIKTASGPGLVIGGRDTASTNVTLRYYDNNGTLVNTVIGDSSGTNGSFTLGSGYAGGIVEATRATNHTIQITRFDTPSLNTAPTLNRNTGVTLNEGASATITATQLDFNDTEQPDTAITYTVTSAATNGTLFKSGAAVGLNGTFTQDDLDNNRITYTHDGGETTTASFGFAVTDGAGGSVTGQSFSFAITPVNDAPTLATNAAGALAYTENAAGTAIVPGLTLSDPDSATITGATVAITGGYVSGQDVLATNGGNGITGSFNTSTGVLTLSGVASVAQYQAALRGVTYANSSEDPSVAARNVAFTVTDGTDPSLAVNRSITITPVNDAPTLTGSLSATVLEGGSHTLVAAELGFSDPDDGAAGETFTVSSLVAGVIQVAGVTRTSFTGTELAAGQVAFVHDGSEGAAAAFSVSVEDGNADHSPPTSSTFTFAVTPVNDPPVLATNAAGALAYTENAAAAAIVPGLTLSDPDSPNLTGATVAITGGFAAGQDVLAFTGANGITGSYDPTTGVLTLAGSATLAQYQAALRSVTYANTSDDPATAVRTVSISANDGSAITTATRDIAVTAVNDAPDLSVSPLSGTANAAIAITGLSFSDPDADGGSETASFSATRGTLAATSSAGVTVGGSGAPGSTLTLAGTLADLNAFLAAGKLTDTAAANDTIDVVINDNGHTGGGAQFSSTKTIAVTLDQPPQITGLNGDSATFTEGGAPVHIDAGANAAVSDSDSSDFGTGSLTVHISLNGVPAEDVLGIDGSVTLSGGLAVGSTVSVGGTAIGTIAADGKTGHDLVVAFNAAATPARVGSLVRALTYANSNTDNPNPATRTVVVTLNDGDGATSAGSNVSIAVAPVNDAPVVDLKTAGLTYTENGVAVAIAPTGVVTDVDSSSFDGGALRVQIGAAGDQLSVLTDASVTLAGTVVSIGNNVVGTVSGADTGDLRVTFTTPAATPAAISTLIQHIGYRSASEDPSAAPHDATFTVTDSGGASGSANAPVTVIPVNDPPAIDLNGAAAGTGAVLNYTEKDAATAIAPAAAVTDVDSADFGGGSLTVRFSANGKPEDQLSILSGGTVSVSGNTVSVGGTSVGSLSGGANGSNLVVSFSAGATPSAITMLLRQIAYANTSNNPSTASRSIAFTVDDGHGGTSTGTATASITETAVNDPPAILTAAAQSLPENTTAVAALTATDPDDAASPAFSISGGADQARFEIVVVGGAPTLAFKAPPDFEAHASAAGSNSYKVEVTATDSHGASTVGSFTVDVTDTNDSPPVFTSGATASEAENTPAATPVYTAAATDADTAPNNVVAYSLSKGGDNAAFSINATTGAVTFKVSPDFEAPTDTGGNNTYDITVHANDGVHDVTQAVAISVSDVNDTGGGGGGGGGGGAAPGPGGTGGGSSTPGGGASNPPSNNTANLPPPPSVAFDPAISVLGSAVTMSGTVSAAAGLRALELFEGSTDLGSATVDPNGTWSFDFDSGSGFHTGIQAVATDSQGRTTTVASSYDLTTGIRGEPYRTVQDSYDPVSHGLLGSTFFKRSGAIYFEDSYAALPDGGASHTYSAGTFFRGKAYSAFADSYDGAGTLTQHVEFNRDGSHAIEVLADGTSVQGLGADTFTDHAASTRFVFDPGVGAETIHGFKAAGPGHDTLDLSSDAGKLAQILAHATGDGQGNTTLHLGHGDTLTLTGVSVAELKQHKGDFTFHA